jgi:hypothetical protein
MSDRRRLLAAAAPALLVIVLATAVVVDSPAWLDFASQDASASNRLVAELERLPNEALVLVAFDPDLGTYAEIRPTVRSLLADLLDRGARLAFISLTPEGRALGSAELARLARLEVADERAIDLGFVPGAEAALVAVSRDLVAEDGGTLGQPPDLAVVVGGNDIGPRSWVEQVAPRVDGLPLVGVAPTVLLPELEPYLDSGQLAALLATPRDGATYRASLSLGPMERVAEVGGPSPLAVLVGMLAAIGVLGAGFVSGGLAALRASRVEEAS